MHRRTFLASAALLTAACAGKRAAEFNYGEAKQKYTLHGVVIRLHADDRVATIQHQKIEGWMEPMTMDFPVPAEADFARLKPGTKIRATVSVNDMYFWLSGIELE